MKWPMPITEAEVKAGQYMKSLSPGEELAVFLSARGHCLEDNGHKAEACVCYAQALARRPDSPDYHSFLVAALGVRQMSDFYSMLPRQPTEPPRIYQTAHDPYAYSRPIRNPGMGWAQPGASVQPYNTFKPNVPSTGIPNSFQNPVPEPGFGFQP
jgi:hypothetical protein